MRVLIILLGAIVALVLVAMAFFAWRSESARAQLADQQAPLTSTETSAPSPATTASSPTITPPTTAPAATTAAAPPPSGVGFQLPLDCRVGQTCFVQNYADWDAGPGARDPMCGPLTYDGHDGLDFRAPKLLADRGVAVLAPADGVVRGMRDGETDGAFLAGGEAALNGKDCGNGVTIDHAGGWQSQLCHMRSGSVRVHTGDHVTAGQPLGLIGLTGHTQFPHVHLTLRLNGAKVDPLTGGAIAAGACGASAMRPGAIWSASARAALAYTGTRWFASGFTGAPPATGADPEALAANASLHAPAMLYWALAIGPHNGDVLRVRLYGPDGAVLSENAHTQTRDQAQAYLFAGRRTPPDGWPAGAYRGEAQLIRNGRVIQTRTETLEPH